LLIDTSRRSALKENAPKRTVFIVDDDEAVRDSLRMLMRAAGLSAVTFATAQDFLRYYLQSRQPGCLLLDIRMPAMSGLDLQAELHKRRIRLPIVFLTGHGDVPMAVKALKAGAVDFIQKPLEEHRLVVAVMNALKFGAKEPSINNSAAVERLRTLSDREREVLQRIIDGKSSREIADELSISIKTVEFHRSNIREKLCVSGLPELFRLVFQRQGEIRRFE
jgi:FixJ family two-component response regulator